MAFPYTEAESIAFAYKPKAVADQIYNGNWLYKRAMEKNAVRILTERQIEIPLQYQKTTVVRTAGELDVVEPAKKQLLNMAIFTPKWLVAHTTLTDEDTRSANSPDKVVDLVKFRMNDLTTALKDQLGTEFYSDGTVANQMDGLRAGISATSTYGGIAQSSYSWWQSGVDTTTTTLTYDVLVTAYGTCVNSGNGEAPTYIVTTQTLFDSVCKLFQPQQRYMGDGAKVGWNRSIPFNDIFIVADNKCPASHLFVINENRIKIYVDKNFDFELTPWKQPVNQPHASTSVMKWNGHIVAEPRYHYKFTALTA